MWPAGADGVKLLHMNFNVDKKGPKLLILQHLRWSGKKNLQFANLRCVKYLAQKYGRANSLTNFILVIKTAEKITGKTIDKTTDIVPLLLSPTCQGRLCLRLGVVLGQLVTPRTGSLFCQLACSLPAIWDPHMPHPLQDMPPTQLFSKNFGHPSEHKTQSQQKILELVVLVEF